MPFLRVVFFSKRNENGFRGSVATKNRSMFVLIIAGCAKHKLSPELFAQKCPKSVLTSFAAAFSRRRALTSLRMKMCDDNLTDCRNFQYI